MDEIVEELADKAIVDVNGEVKGWVKREEDPMF